MNVYQLWKRVEDDAVKDGIAIVTSAGQLRLTQDEEECLAVILSDEHKAEHWKGKVKTK